MKRLMVLMLAGFLFGGIQAAPIIPGDSIGKKIVKGKRFVLYKIAPGDNLSMVARDYNSSVKDLIKLNEMDGTALRAGQVIMVPGRGDVDVAAAPAKNKVHVVQPGETLYALSRQYSVSVENIQKWNNISGAALDVGQVLQMGDPSSLAETDPDQKAVADAEKGGILTVEKPRPEIRQRPGRHIVQQGETLFGIAKTYGMDTREIKKINDLRSNEIKEGQELMVRGEMPANSNQGKSLMNMIEEVTEEKPADEKEEFPELEVLTVKKKVTLAPNAKVEVYTDKFSRKQYKRIEEKGEAGPIEDFNTDQTRFYAFHKYVPAGSYLRIDHPARGQSILVEVINSLPENDPYVVRLSAKSMDYLMIRKAGSEVVLRYVIPMAK